MRVFLIFVLLCLAAVQAAPNNQQRIVGGTNTSISDWPYSTALLLVVTPSQFRQFCVGTILTSTAILSAAQCIQDYPVESWRARVGSTYASSGGVVHELRVANNHPGFSTLTYDNDISVIRTVEPIIYNENVQPGSIAGPNYIIADNTEVWAVGWGVTNILGPSSEELLEVQILTVNHDTCRDRYEPLNRNITDNMLCSGLLDVGGHNQCIYDYGGPLLHNDVVVGVFSFSVCGLAQYPGVNTRVSGYTDWIQENAA